MRRGTTCALVLGAAALAAALPARPAAACSGRHLTVFAKADLADVVAVVRPRAVPPDRGRLPGAGPVRLDVVESIEDGRRPPPRRPRTRLVAQETNTSCHVGYRRGRRALVFLARDGWLVGVDGYVEDYAPFLPYLRRWAAAKTAADKVAILLDAVDDHDRFVSGDGAAELADHPDLLAAIDRAGRDRLAAAAAHARPESMIAAVLARLGDPRAKAIAQRRARASRWLRYHPVVEYLAHRRFEAVDDPAILAGVIANGAREVDPDRVAALERCERVRGVQLFPFSWYADGVSLQFWRTLAAACRDGKPVR